MNKDRAITLIEMMAVLVIISILVVIAVPNYQRTVEQARDKEALACLRLIQAGERIYRSEQEPTQFFPWDTVPAQVQDLPAHNEINAGLRLSLTTQHWTYKVEEEDASNNFKAVATRKGPPPGFVRDWVINNENCNTIFGAYCSGAGCPYGSGNDLACLFP